MGCDGTHGYEDMRWSAAVANAYRCVGMEGWLWMLWRRRAAALRLRPLPLVEPPTLRPSRHPATTSPGLCGRWSVSAPSELLQNLHSKYTGFLARNRQIGPLRLKRARKEHSDGASLTPQLAGSPEISQRAPERAQSWEPVGSSNLRRREGVKRFALPFAAP